MATMAASGVLKEWLEEKGHYQYVDAPFVVDDEQVAKLKAECHCAHPEYSDEQATAWAVYSVLTRNSVSEADHQRLGDPAAQSLARQARAHELQSQDFRQVARSFRELGAAVERNGQSLEGLSHAILERDQSNRLLIAKAREDSAALGLWFKSINDYWHGWAETNRNERIALWIWRSLIVSGLGILCVRALA